MKIYIAGFWFSMGGQKKQGNKPCAWELHRETLKNWKFDYNAHGGLHVLDSYAHIKNVPIEDHIKLLREQRVTSWCLDCGAFSLRGNKAVKVEEYIEYCKKVLKSSFPPSEIFGLDVIGNAEATLQNCLTMRKAGLIIVPAYHQGEDERYIKEYCRLWNKIAFGGLAGFSKRTDFANEYIGQLFARIYPKRIHLFGVTNFNFFGNYPIDTADSSSWAVTFRFGHYYSMPGISAKTMTQDVNKNSSNLFLPEVKRVLVKQREMNGYWCKEYQRLDTLDKERNRG